MDRLTAICTVAGVAALVLFTTQFDPNMRGNERAMLEIAIGGVLGGAAIAMIVRRGLRGSPFGPIAVLLLIVTVGIAIAFFGDVRADRGNKKALAALGAGAAFGAAALALVLLRPPAPLTTPPAS